MPVPTQADRAAELNRLIVDQGTAAQRMRYGWKPTDAEQQDLNRKADRMHELAELLNAHEAYAVPVGKYLNDRIAAWLKMNPLPLTVGALAEAADDATSDQGVYVTIGELGNYGYRYRVMRDDLATDARPCTIQVPDSVAEHFRQQGRRALQSEMRSLLNVSRA